MKKMLFTVVAALALAVSLVSCNSNSPKGSAEKWLNSFYHMDYKEAKNVSTDETKKVLDMLEQFSSMVPDSQKTNAKKIKIDIKDVKEEGEKATVTYTTSENTQDQKVELVKQNGKWLVEWSKQDNAEGAGMEEGGADEAMMSDTTAVPATDPVGEPTAADTAMKK